MVNLYLIRHGECEGTGLYIGRGSDVSLIKKGREQIETLADYLNRELSGRKIHHFYSSPLKRTLESSLIISKSLNINIEPVVGLEEIDFGDWESQSYDEIRIQSYEKLHRWIDNPIENHPPAGESLVQLKNRVVQSLRDIIPLIDREDSYNIILVSHRGPIAVLLLHFLGMELDKFWNFKIDRGSISKMNLYPRLSEVDFLNRKF